MLAGILTPLLWLIVLVVTLLVRTIFSMEITTIEYIVAGVVSAVCIGHLLNILWKGRKS